MERIETPIGILSEDCIKYLFEQSLFVLGDGEVQIRDLIYTINGRKVQIFSLYKWVVESLEDEGVFGAEKQIREMIKRKINIYLYGKRLIESR
jgi:hypothetical protein